MPDLIAAGRMDQALLKTWAHVAEQLPESEQLPATGLTASLHQEEFGEIVLVTMPPAEHVTEAHFAAVVLPKKSKGTRYIVLEHSWSLSDEPATVLGEWTQEGHLNLGAGPSPSVSGFLSAVRRLAAPS